MATVSPEAPTTSPSSTEQRDRSAAAFTIEQIIHLPLPQVLAAKNAETVDVSVDEQGFFGLIMRRRSDERLILAMPTGRSEIERDCVARFMIARWSGLDTSSFPAFLQATEYLRHGSVMAQSRESLRAEVQA